MSLLRGRPAPGGASVGARRGADGIRGPATAPGDRGPFACRSGWVHGLGFVALAAGCGAPEPAPPLPNAAVATGVQAVGDGWSAAAATLQLGAGPAQAGEVAVVKDEPGRPPLEITAARSEWDLRARSAHFEGDVHVRRGDVAMTCTALDVRYADAQRIDRVLASGSVEVHQGERTATAAQAELTGATGRIALTGTPRLSEGPNTLVGTTIVLWLDDERATCEGAGGEPCRLVVDGTALK